MHTLRFALLSLVLMLAACERKDNSMPSSAPERQTRSQAQPQLQAQPQAQGLYLRYYTSGETNYTEITVDGAHLTYTFFDDAENRCEQWFKSEPCWTHADLQTMTRTLAPEDQQDLQAALEYSGILSLQGDLFGVTDPQQRAYSERMEIRLNGQERKLTYRSRPDADPKPKAFRQVEVALRGYLSPRK